MTVPMVVGTGLVALDVVFRGQTQEPVRTSTGGTCGNVLSILRYLGWKSIPLARLADDRASAAVRADLERWGVDVRFLSLESVEAITASLPAPTVFFFDRPSRGALKLAEVYREENTLIVFEPSARGDAEFFTPALAQADVVKYSDQRFATLPRHRAKEGRLEIQTLGADGLRFRVARSQKLGAWHRLPAIPSAQVVDTAGAGDWCTAGLLKEIGVDGRAGFSEQTIDKVRAALRYGQALASWNCRFEGARGGMYEQSKRVFEREVDALLKGAVPSSAAEPGLSSDGALGELCPSCPSNTGPVVPRDQRQGSALQH